MQFRENEELAKHKNEVNYYANESRNLKAQIDKLTQDLETVSQKYNSLKVTYEDMRKTLAAVKVCCLQPYEPSSSPPPLEFLEFLAALG